MGVVAERDKVTLAVFRTCRKGGKRCKERDGVRVRSIVVVMSDDMIVSPPKLNWFREA